MAYGTKYRFTFDSVLGTPFRILIKKDGYSGSVLDRRLGGSPVLRRDKSDGVCGTSLEIPAECAVDGEFEEFKTSVPFTFLVELYGGSSLNTLIWTGYVTPELMSAPDIAPPYDVQVSCTDGLGELKYREYPARGEYSLEDHLEYLLSFTNLSLPLEMVNDIYHGSYGAASFLSKTAVNLDFLEGETCYDVLQGILTALHATITQQNGAWLIFRETGAVITQRPGSNVYIPTSSGRGITVDNFGSLDTHQDGWWPVGYMSHSNEPPRKRMTLTSENHYVENLLSNALWQAVSGGVDSGDFWTLASAGAGMKQTQSFVYPISKKLLLTIKVRNVGSGGDAGKLSLKVKAVGTSYAGSRTYYLANGSYARRNEQTDFSWQTDEVDSVIDVQAPAPEDTDEDYVNLGIVIPVYRNSARDYFYCTSLEISISNKEGTYEQRVYDVILSKYERFSGFRKTVDLNNGARGEGSDLDLIFATVTGGNVYNGVEQLMLGVPVDSTSYDAISSWYSSKFTTGLDYLSLMARDYALSIAAARTRLRGTLNVPVGRARIPVCFQDDHDSAYYFIETLSWSLLNDELEVDMISRPSADITVSQEGLEEAESNNDNGHSQGTPSSGGGGGGGTGTVTSVGVSVPSGMTVSGSPVTSSGTIQIGLETGNSIHGHSNKNTLDNISAQDVQHWEVGYQYAHGHNNKSVLDGITAAKVAQWDAAGADTIDIYIGGTNAAPTVAVELGSGSSDYVALPEAATNKSGIVNTQAQKFTGAKTFDRIYLGNSEARGAYIEWDDTRRAWKLVGDVYATGDVAAGE